MSAFPSMMKIYDLTTEAGRLPPNWDGDQAPAIRPESVQRGLQLMESLSLLVSPNAVEPLPQGGRLQYRWSGADGDLLMEIVPGRERFILHRVPLRGGGYTKEVFGLAAATREIIHFVLFPNGSPTPPPQGAKVVHHETLPYS